jgi:aminopeptidase N
VFNIVAVDDFNMGAMENKGLNIFNSRYVLASPETATDRITPHRAHRRA